MSQPDIAWRWILPSGAAALALYLLSSGPLAYGYMSDEFYYLDCAAHLALGYVDHPPLSIAVLAIVRAVLGDSLLALHVVPALLHVAAIALVALLARELGGGRVAQALASLSALICPVYLADASFYSMNAFEPPIWALAALLVARILNGARPSTWVWLGAVLGLGLMNKISILWFGLGLAVGLVLTPQRRWLATPWPWLGALMSLVIFAPHLVWQMQNGWPTLEFMRNAAAEKMTHKSVLGFLAEQLLVMGPPAVPLWLGGLVLLFAGQRGARYRLLGWLWLTVIALLALSGSARSNYSGPAYVVLLAAGGVAWEGVSAVRGWRFAPLVVALLLVLGLAAAPLAIPLLPPERYPGYARALGIEPPVDQVDELGTLPLHFALRFGWREVVDAVASAYDGLTPDERARAAVFGHSFGDTGALNFLGPALGLPHAVSGHNNYWLWGPGDIDGSVVIALAESEADLLPYFASVERVSGIDCHYCLPAVRHLSVFVCRGLRRPVDQIWPELKRYV
jgi:hypothetical protein